MNWQHLVEPPPILAQCRLGIFLFCLHLWPGQGRIAKEGAKQDPDSPKGGQVDTLGAQNRFKNAKSQRSSLANQKEIELGLIVSRILIWLVNPWWAYIPSFNENCPHEIQRVGIENIELVGKPVMSIIPLFHVNYPHEIQSWDREYWYGW